MNIPVLLLPYYLAVIIETALIAYALSHRRVPISRPFIALMASADLWCLFSALALSINEPTIKFWFARGTFIGLSTGAIAWYLFARALNGETRPLALWQKILFIAIPAVIITTALIGGEKNPLRYDFRMLSESGIGYYSYKNGPLFWVHYALFMCLMIAAIVILAKNFKQKPKFRRRQILMFYGAIYLIVFADILFQAGLRFHPLLNPTPALMALSCAIVAYAAYRYRIFASAPVTRDLVMDVIGDLVLIADTEGRLIDANAAAIAVLGIARQKDFGLSLGAINPVLSTISAKLPSRENEPADITLTVNERQVIYEANRHSIEFAKDEKIGDLIQMRDVTELRKKTAENDLLQARLLEDAIHDHLTGLYNRRYLGEVVEKIIAGAGRGGGSIALIMADIDHFKILNDREGHPAGDAVLAALGAHLGKRLRKSDYAFRYGGDELLIVLPGTDAGKATILAESLHASAGALGIHFGGKILHISISFGVADYPACGSSMNAVLEAADGALYQAKALGRDRVVCARLSATTTAGMPASISGEAIHHVV